jgi:hypothetical protein
MGQQLRQRDFAGVRRIRQIRRQPGIDIQLAGLSQLKNGGRRELLGDGTY